MVDSVSQTILCMLAAILRKQAGYEPVTTSHMPTGSQTDIKLHGQGSTQKHLISVQHETDHLPRKLMEPLVSEHAEPTNPRNVNKCSKSC